MGFDDEILEYLVYRCPEMDVRVGVGRPVVKYEDGQTGPDAKDFVVEIDLVPPGQSLGFSLAQIGFLGEVSPGHVKS
jgi:hypothetical protein